MRESVRTASLQPALSGHSGWGYLPAPHLQTHTTVTVPVFHSFVSVLCSGVEVEFATNVGQV